MPKCVFTDDHSYHVTMNSMDLMVGPLKVAENSLQSQVSLPFASQLQCLALDVRHAVLLVAPECLAVFRDDTGRYGFFDSHSRSATGFPYHSGTAIMLTFLDFSDLVDHVHKLLQDRGSYASYELMPVSFSRDYSDVTTDNVAVLSEAETEPSAFLLDGDTLELGDDLIIIPDAALDQSCGQEVFQRTVFLEGNTSECEADTVLTPDAVPEPASNQLHQRWCSCVRKRSSTFQELARADAGKLHVEQVRSANVCLLVKREPLADVSLKNCNMPVDQNFRRRSYRQ